jgi:sec-independent protein translocase protein TatA
MVVLVKATNYARSRFPRGGAAMNPTPVVANIVGPDLLIVLAVLVLLFGGAKIPKLARSLGQASHEFKKGIADGAEDDGAVKKGLADGAEDDGAAP